MSSTPATGTLTAVGSGLVATNTDRGEVSWTVTGTFVGQVIIEHSLGGQDAWQHVRSQGIISAPASGTFPGDPSGAYRFRCTAFTSGTISYTLTPPGNSLLPTAPPPKGSGIWWSNSGVIGVA